MKLRNSRMEYQETEGNMRIIDIEGIGPVYAGKLAKIGIRSTDALLKKGASPDGRKEIAAAAGIGDALVLEWVNLADLYRIKGVGSEYSDLLEEAGVDTVVELSKRVAQNLHAQMAETNKAKNLVNKMPGLKQVGKWIQQAKRLPRVVTY
jgi:predicted flap endonuclease-1-like 5' DNA nuclease